MKKLLLIFLLLISGCKNNSVNIGGDTKLDALSAEKVNMEISSISQEQENNIDLKGKYKNIPEFEKDGVKYRTYSYITPSGESGYEVYIEGKTFKKVTAYGADSIGRYYEEVFEEKTNSTSTIIKE